MRDKSQDWDMRHPRTMLIITYVVILGLMVLGIVFVSVGAGRKGQSMIYLTNFGIALLVSSLMVLLGEFFTHMRKVWCKQIDKLSEERAATAGNQPPQDPPNEENLDWVERFTKWYITWPMFSLLDWRAWGSSSRQQFIARLQRRSWVLAEPLSLY